MAAFGVRDVLVTSVRKNEASSIVSVFLSSDSDPANAVDDDEANLEAEVSVDGGASTSLDGATYFSQPATPIAGVYEFTPPQAQTNGDLICIRFDHSNAAYKVSPETVFVYTLPPWIDDMLGSGFVTADDSLEGLRNYFVTYILPQLRAEASVTEFSGTGWLSTLTEGIRRWTDEPITSTKYGPTKMLKVIQEGIRELFTENLLLSDRQVLVRHTITINEDLQDYVLPPNVSQIWQIAKIDEDSGRPTHEIRPVGAWDPARGFRVEGNILRLTSKKCWVTGDEYEVLYVPNGDVRPWKGVLTLSATTTDEISADGLTVTLASGDLSSEDGSLDTRLNSYGGYQFRVLTCSVTADDVEQVRAVASSTVDATGNTVLTLRVALSPIPDTVAETVTCELVPAFEPLFEDTLAVLVARNMLIADGNERRAALLTRKLQEKCRNYRFHIQKAQMREATRFEGQDRDNLDYAIVGGFWGFWW